MSDRFELDFIIAFRANQNETDERKRASSVQTGIQTDRKIHNNAGTPSQEGGEVVYRYTIPIRKRVTLQNKLFLYLWLTSRP